MIVTSTIIKVEKIMSFAQKRACIFHFCMFRSLNQYTNSNIKLFLLCVYVFKSFMLSKAAFI